MRMSIPHDSAPALVLVNLGTPSAPTAPAVRHFLRPRGRKAFLDEELERGIQQFLRARFLAAAAEGEIGE